MTYPLINGSEINGSESSSQGPGTRHGTPKVLVVLHAAGAAPATTHGEATAELGYDAVLKPAGRLATRHGTPLAVSTPVTVGRTVLQAASSGIVTRHGVPAVKGSVSLQAVGHAPSTRHGTPGAVAFLLAQGHLATQHGTPKAATALRPAGHCTTAHGTARVVTLLHAAGHLATKHGLPGRTASAVLLAQGHLDTRHGSPRIGRLVLHAFSTAPNVRHGKPIVLRGTQC